MKEPKFAIGDLVKFKKDSNTEAGKILSFTYSSEEGYRYQIEAKEVNIREKKIVTGVKNCLESELVLIKK